MKTKTQTAEADDFLKRKKVIYDALAKTARKRRKKKKLIHDTDPVVSSLKFATQNCGVWKLLCEGSIGESIMWPKPKIKLLS